MSTTHTDAIGQDETLRRRLTASKAAEAKVKEAVRIQEETARLKEDIYEESETAAPKGSLASLLRVLRISIALCVVILLFYLKRGGERYQDTLRGATFVDTNPYMVLGLKREASDKQIKQAYKKLMRQWHPDKNPGCTVCAEKINGFKDAYGILGDEKSRRDYDMSRVKKSYNYIESTYSIELDESNYDNVMGRLNDRLSNPNPMVLQVYDPTNELSRSFATLWDAAAERLQSYQIDFARIDGRTHPDLLKKLPNRIVQYPTIMLLEKDTNPLIFNLSSGKTKSDMERWIRSNLAVNFDFRRLEKEADMENWIQETDPEERVQGLYPFEDDLPRIVLVSNKKITNSVIRRLVLRYKGVCNIAKLAATDTSEEIKKLRLYGSDLSMVLLKHDSAEVDRHVISRSTDTVDMVYSVMQLLSSRALPLTERSIAPLCMADIPDTRIICNVNLATSAKDIRQLNKFSKNMARPETKKKKKSDDEDHDYTTWIYQNVYVVDIPEENVENMKSLLNEKESLLLDIGARRYSRGPPASEMIDNLAIPKVSSLDFHSLSKEANHMCLKSYSNLAEKCLPVGRMTAVESVKYWFRHLSTVKTLVLVGFAMISLMLFTLIPIHYWLMVVIAAAFILQLFLL